MTKNELEKLSDFEINQSVALELFNGSAGGSTDKSEVWCACMPNDCYGYFDPCNNWSDMGPLAFDNKISILNDGEFIGASNSVDHFRENTENLPWLFKCYDDNPLRAAAIVYLLIQDGE